ncbi:single-stranded DNA-binding protein [Paractinoplanes toevensis]|uniref:Single-stranded DNA-binding protein 1 n=1 Tax=Paractinoplanes toevensis TaxID=571911 RepID=A0A920BQC7_9ACTN|nr:single-stranded DNA-binding protein [Actinoplanes toevensis]GIM96960.1 single-stranded DNA-binding protein 1 [Actinoplanes toevensis]
MFDTNLVVVGNVLTAPEWRRIASTGSLVANFRVASTARRFDRENNRWVDGNHLRVRVSAWRRLAEGVASSLAVGDPVVIYGRLFTRDWTDEDNKPRVSYEMEAMSIGHDLSRGRARFFRNKAAQVAAVEDAESEAVVTGELSEPVPAEEMPIGFGEGLPLAAEEPPTFAEPDPVPVEVPAVPEGEDELTLEVERLVAEQPAGARRTRRTKREPVAA